MDYVRARRGTDTEWTTANIILRQGELGYESNTGRLKVGNGENVWNELSYSESLAPSKTLHATVITVPDATANLGNLLFVTDEVDGATLAYSNGTNWLRIYDNVIISI